MESATFPFTRADAAISDAALIEAIRACARRSQTALRQIYDASAPQLLAQLVQMLGDREQAEAALHDCLLRVWQEAAWYRADLCAPRVWLRAVARRVAIERLHATPAQPLDEEGAAQLRLVDAAGDPAAGAARTGLNEEQARCLHLAYASGRSPADIAGVLELPVASVRRLIRGALAAITVGAGS
jgi:DNA-directed RNA polymerase specialized sigma24 family protein